jgi:hypothetical protein
MEEELALVVIVLECLKSMQLAAELFAAALDYVKLEVVEDGSLVVFGSVL